MLVSFSFLLLVLVALAHARTKLNNKRSFDLLPDVLPEKGKVVAVGDVNGDLQTDLFVLEGSNSIACYIWNSRNLYGRLREHRIIKVSEK